MKFDSDDTKKLPFQVEIRRKGVQTKPYNSQNAKYSNTTNNNKKANEEKAQEAQENIENLKKILDSEKGSGYVNPLKAAFQQREEIKVLAEKAAEKKRQEQNTQRLLYQEYKRKQEASKTYGKTFRPTGSFNNYNSNSSNNNSGYNNTQNSNNLNYKKTIVAPRFTNGVNNTPQNNNFNNFNNKPNNYSKPPENPFFKNKKPEIKVNIYNTGIIRTIGPSYGAPFNKPPQQQYNKRNSKDHMKKKKVLKAADDNFDWKKYVGDDGVINSGPNKKKGHKNKDKNSLSSRQTITITKDMTLFSLCTLISVPLDRLIRQAKDLGINEDTQQTLDKDALFLILDMNGFDCHIYGTEELFIDYIKIDESTCDKVRPPVVCVLGHVDHGKTSFLDKIRETSVVDIEAGGITQNITLWQLDKYGKAIFVDTPGHSVFSIMRKVGLIITDIVILLIAGDDGVKDQTIEILKTINIMSQTKDIKIIIGITKIDKLDKATKEKNLHSIYSELSKYEVIPEAYGGEIKVICISNKTGEGIKDMLQTIEDTTKTMTVQLKYNQSRQAIGTIVNSYVEKGIGIVAYILLKHGTLKPGDKFITGKISGKVRLILSPVGKKVCNPENIIKISGFEGEMPKCGDDFIVLEDEELMKNILLIRNKLLDNSQEGPLLSALNREKIHILLKADTTASLESLETALIALSSKIAIKIFHQSVGTIMLSDVEKAAEFGLVIVGFNTKVDNDAQKAISSKSVKVICEKIVYRILEEVEMLTKKTETVITETLIGTCEVRHIFTFNKTVIAGCRVMEGSIFHSIQHTCEVFRDKVSIYKGSISSMKREKDNIKEAKQGTDVGIVFDYFNDTQIKDIIRCYKLTSEVKVIE
jgi:translation initiation factor IF-2